MKNAVQKFLHGWEGLLFQGGVARIASLALCVACCVAVLAPTRAAADSNRDRNNRNQNNRPTTELKYLQTLVQLCGDADKFGPDSKPADYVRWARNNGLNPSGGWHPNSALTAQTIAQTLVQLIDLNPRKFGGNFFKILEREGIFLPRGQVSLRTLNALFDDGVLQKTIFKHCHNNSPHKPPHGGGGHGGGKDDDGKDDDKGDDNKGHDDKGDDKGDNHNGGKGGKRR